MNSTDQAVRDIGIIWDNDEATHRFIVETVKFSSSWMEVSSKLQMFYEKSIDYVLSQFSSKVIGVQLIDQQVSLHPRDVFDELARDYWFGMQEPRDKADELCRNYWHIMKEMQDEASNCL